MEARSANSYRFAGYERTSLKHAAQGKESRDFKSQNSEIVPVGHGSNWRGGGLIFITASFWRGAWACAFEHYSSGAPPGQSRDRSSPGEHTVTRIGSTGRRSSNRKWAVSYTHLRAHETVLDLVCRLLLEKKKINNNHYNSIARRKTKSIKRR